MAKIAKVTTALEKCDQTKKYNKHNYTIALFAFLARNNLQKWDCTPHKWHFLKMTHTDEIISSHFTIRSSRANVRTHHKMSEMKSWAEWRDSVVFCVVAAVFIISIALLNKWYSVLILTQTGEFILLNDRTIGWWNLYFICRERKNLKNTTNAHRQQSIRLGR